MKKVLWVPFLVLILLTFSIAPIFAQSSYVLPYPSAMPGSFLYKPRLLFEKLNKYWYFGNFGQFTYSLKQSDKYLVEAKTLFEYKQYLLGYNALKKSDRYFKETLPNLEKAQEDEKNITQNRLILSSAAQRHIEILEIIAKDAPEEFIWQPEKERPSKLKIKAAIQLSILLRNKSL
ncbi:MAG: hypothetical protein WD992_03180 [Candidatus Levyibacteriota bacterium]